MKGCTVIRNGRILTSGWPSCNTLSTCSPLGWEQEPVFYITCCQPCSILLSKISQNNQKWNDEDWSKRKEANSCHRQTGLASTNNRSLFSLEVFMELKSQHRELEINSNLDH